MGKEREMKWVMIVGIVMMMVWEKMVPSSAQQQQQQQPKCWENIISCIEGVKTQDEFQQQCCGVFVQTVTDEKPCFCSVNLQVSRNPDLLRTLNSLFSLCGITQSFNTICPGPASSPIGSPSMSPQPTEEGSCWGPITDCIMNNTNRSETEEKFDPTSPKFNATEYYCCPLIQEAALEEQECFCAMSTLVKRNPSRGANITSVLSTCDIVDSVSALHDYCQAAAESPATAPSSPSQLQSLFSGN